jgi:hypothetical protein
MTILYILAFVIIFLMSSVSSCRERFKKSTLLSLTDHMTTRTTNNFRLYARMEDNYCLYIYITHYFLFTPQTLIFTLLILHRLRAIEDIFLPANSLAHNSQDSLLTVSDIEFHNLPIYMHE